ncbi:hypothetical protein F4821DRAFT_247136 [Hypoxylon rubiginosum]|uniref:Uncharacterized protein n=1 Tax=Hypoxylon rubiginosum TaxID=110542 RepID=A0ACC0CPP9_9PEZI|nr:hypothetical protein F4821DRAFT_247136 [Hypoxylon rubiginosum]
MPIIYHEYPMEYIKTLRDLQALGMSHVADLPELVLVDDWSSSQSSLPSASALPQSASVRKCCPFHINLSDNASWSCAISLQRKPFKTIYNRSEMNEALRWAQVANLNPGRNHELFIPDEGSIAKEIPFDIAARDTDAQFSPNVITLDIKGPGLPDLSFYDLPSVSTSAEKKDEQAAKAIKNLVMEYLEREKALIVWALPIHVPFENSASWDIIRESGAIDRTIGVLTKADQFSSQDIPACLAMFRKEGQEVGHGFFAISQQSKQLNEAISWEELLFPLGAGDLAAWPNELAEFKRRCGARALLNYLLSQIGQAFVRRLPSIKTMVGARLTSVQSDLATLPGFPVDANAEHDAKKSLVQVLQKMKTAIDTEFSPRWNTLNEQFRACLFTMKPICKLKGSDTPVINTFNVNSDIATPRSRLDNLTIWSEDTMSRPIEQDIPIDSTPQASSTNSPFSNFGCGTIDIEKIRNEIIRHSRPDMVQHAMPDEVLETLCLDEIKKWKLPLETYISKTTELLKKTASAVLEASLGEFRYRLLFSECQEKLEKFIDKAIAFQRGRLNDLYNSETYQLFIMNDDSFDRHKAQEMEQLHRMRNILRLKVSALIPRDTPIKKFGDMSEEEKTQERKILNKMIPKLPKDPFDDAIEVTGFVRGYYMLAAARFGERVVMNVNSSLLRTFRESELQSLLDDHFNIFSSDPSLYIRLLEEDSNTSKRRIQLTAELDKLVTAMRRINELESSSGNVEP